MADPRLPKDMLIDDGVQPTCPWCRCDCGAATVTLEQIRIAADHRELKRATRMSDATAEECAVVAHCPDCMRPFMVTLTERYAPETGSWTVMRLMPVRTTTDARYTPPPAQQAAANG